MSEPVEQAAQEKETQYTHKCPFCEGHFVKKGWKVDPFDRRVWDEPCTHCGEVEAERRMKALEIGGGWTYLYNPLLHALERAHTCNMSKHAIKRARLEFAEAILKHVPKLQVVVAGAAK